MIPFITAQTDFISQALGSIGKAIDDIFVQYGPFWGIVLTVLLIIFVTWAGQRRTTNKRDEEEIKRNALIRETAAESSRQANRIAELERNSTKAEGKVELLTYQLEQERRIAADERAETRKKLEELENKSNSDGKRIDELKLELKGLYKERDELLKKNAELETRNAHLFMENEHKDAIIREQAEQIESLSKQLVIIDPPHTGQTDKMKPIDPI